MWYSRLNDCKVGKCSYNWTTTLLHQMAPLYVCQIDIKESKGEHSAATCFTFERNWSLGFEPSSSSAEFIHKLPNKSITWKCWHAMLTLDRHDLYHKAEDRKSRSFTQLSFTIFSHSRVDINLMCFWATPTAFVTTHVKVDLRSSDVMFFNSKLLWRIAPSSRVDLMKTQPLQPSYRLF